VKTCILTLIFAVTAQGATFTKSKIILGKVQYNVEVADTDELRERGLMGREKLSDNEGMIFIFDEAQPQGFWMKNTLIPLSIGFFDEKGKLFQVTDMEPASPMDLSPKVYRSTRPAKFALEEPRGWFSRKKILVNQTQLRLPDLHLP
jgi:uncharacterized membrane protein (UPF0127 family)